MKPLKSQSDAKPIRCKRVWTIPARLDFHSRETASGCREWTARTTKGYGQLWWNGKLHYAHRLAYGRYHGPIPDGMQVCHRCDNPLCINPQHLFLGDHAANAADKVTKNRQSRCIGNDNGRAKLTPDQVAEIRSTKPGQRGLAKRYGVNRSQILRVRKGEAWAAIKGGTRSIAGVEIYEAANTRIVRR